MRRLRRDTPPARSQAAGSCARRPFCFLRQGASATQIPKRLARAGRSLAFMCAQSLFLPCVSTVGILYSEARSLTLLAAVVVYSLVLPFGLAILVYQAARLLS
ncbi:hypothetical protein CNY67_15160 [Desulfovibrio sp. G11]|uniref:Nucleoside transporter/FeoB GTPase Gate domain-containing protein n=2 Tax=Desulfovibrionaceae TaxID=194924 RepID=A0ABQ0ECH6_9BACT|nr:hypothetical protein CNY67_15160 [Desulfovibrio sp. G11]